MAAAGLAAAARAGGAGGAENAIEVGGGICAGGGGPPYDMLPNIIRGFVPSSAAISLLAIDGDMGATGGLGDPATRS
jgi:hypothetical protein